MAVRCDAATDMLEYSGSGVPDPETAFNVIFWTFLSFDRNDYSTMLRSHNSGGTVANIATDNDGVSLSYFTAGGSLLSSYDLVAGAWSRVAASCTGTSGVLYGAGATGSVTVTSGTVNGAEAPNGFAIGGRGNGDTTEHFNGRIAAFKIYSAVLTQAEIEAEWQQVMPVRRADLQFWYPLPSAGDITDWSGNGRNLTAGSTAVTTEDGPPIPWSRAVVPVPSTAARRRAALY